MQQIMAERSPQQNIKTDKDNTDWYYLFLHAKKAKSEDLT